MKKQDIIKNSEEYILSTYTKTPAIFVKGKGMTLTDIDGKKYLDFFPGWGVNNVGHCHPKVVSAVRDQISKLIHIPNNFYHPQQAKLAKEIGISHLPIWKMANGEAYNPSLEMLDKLCKFFKCKPGDILEYKNN